jgi:hypothetical protein
MEVCSQNSHFPPEKRNPVPRQQEAGLVPELVYMLWRRGKSLAPPENRTLIASAAHKMQPQTCHNMRLLNYNLK